jgi:hypothetical protein
MEIVFFVILLLAVLFGIGYAVFSFFTSPGGVESTDRALGGSQTKANSSTVPMAMTPPAVIQSRATEPYFERDFIQASISRGLRGRPG